MTRLVTTKQELRQARAALDGTVAVVMTMGALHAGHLALVDHARTLADHVILTDFVNPLQFGPEEDFERYPRDLDADLRLVDGLVDLVFAPSVEEMYPMLPPMVTVTVGDLAAGFEGTARPGHFAGVATVVLKLLLLTQPDIAVFGRKDAQQLAIVQRLVGDLDVPVEIAPVPLQREPSGLARSSRNAYLDDAGRQQALALSRLVTAVEAAAPSTTAVLREIEQARERQEVDWEYAAAVDPATFAPIGSDHRGETVVVMTARVQGVRLLDTTVVQLSAP
ncbi:pantoate--beta-alanine ligase [Brachybacterium sp. EF45031]|uniref:pantoate--beta-alanine ligase n=1 Tax=Brachybacterium sillae TaxID=2810536 RepID=UPI00217ED2FA|nr:pantoate--beta-alanine ligase [Brachybacterium sillae]MCS6712603.1 pantoate--beta-alanine ligase [Brachybacterium sillae]